MKIAVTVLLLIIIPAYGQSGYFDFLNKGMTETMTSYKGEWKFVNGKIIVIEHGSKFIKSEIIQEKNKPPEEVGIWGFKMLVKIPSEKDLFDSLVSEAAPTYDKYERVANEAKRKGGPGSYFDVSNSGIKMENVLSNFLNVEYELLDKDGFHICTGYKTYCNPKATTKIQNIYELFNTKRDGVYEIYGKGRIPMSDLRRVESWTILIRGYVED